MSLYLSGQAQHNSELDLLLSDNLASMGSAVTTEQGSLAWCEAYALAKTQMAALNFIRLISNQFTPSQMSVYARRWASIYQLPVTGENVIPSNIQYLQTIISLKEALFGTNNGFSNIYQYIKGVLGQIFIDIEFNYDLQYNGNALSIYAYQYLSTPLTGMSGDKGDYWFDPLAIVYARVWQPRDNQDNLLMPTSKFLVKVETYKKFVEEWSPAYSTYLNMQLLYVGNDGYGINSSNIQGNNADGYVQYGSLNTISGTAGQYFIHCHAGTNPGVDMYGVTAYRWHMPIEVVDDNNQLQTYHVNTIYTIESLPLTYDLGIDEAIVNNITNRSYRLLGVQTDTVYMPDNALLSI